MTLNQSAAALRALFKRWFHKRNLIIVSKQKVIHVPIGVGLQLCILLLAASVVFWASYSTGRYITARSALKTQGQTLRNLASAQIESSFNTLFKANAYIGGNEPKGTKAETVLGLSSMDNQELMARVAYLQNKVNELQTANATIIARVREKTSGRIEDLEAIIQQTGLNPGELKKQMAKKNGDEKTGSEKFQGGPFIADDSLQSVDAVELYGKLDELALLGQIVDTLPLGKPVAGAEEQSGFGHRIDPFTGRLAFHSGLDLSGPAGAKILCTAAGTVVAAGRDGAYGNMVDVDHGFGIVTRYGHLSQILVEKGQQVSKGDVVGIQGSTGRSTGPHLHYEVRLHNQPTDPKNFLKAGRYVSQN